MEKKRFTYLFGQYYKGEVSTEEKNEFFFMLNSGDYDDQLSGLIDFHFEHFERHTDPFSTEAEQRMLQSIFKVRAAERGTGGRAPLIRKLWSRIAVAASIVLVAGTVLYLYHVNSRQDVTAGTSAGNLIVPGKHSATLTLANGKKIILSDAVNGTLTREAGININKTADGRLVYEIKNRAEGDENKINTLSTAKGETYQVRLPDGSMVTLNAASSLSYATSLNKNGERRVELKGEGYFEVAKDKKHPFIVKTPTQEISVLGTHFNVNAYADEEVVKTTLLEGSVRIRTAGEQRMLIPGEQAIVRGDKVSISKADIESAVAWKNGEFVFTGQPITEIMRVLSRWYNVEVEFNGPVTKEQFEGSALKEKNITDVLELLELTGAVHFKIEGRKIIVSR
jgi:transmembrane sensor